MPHQLLHAQPCQLRRSNAMRVKARNFELLPASMRQSILAFRSAHQQAHADLQQVQQGFYDSTKLSLCEQIKEGVRLHPVRTPKKLELENFDFNQRNYNEPKGSLVDLLARVLAKRNSVMQTTDDESESSSIDSQSEMYFSDNSDDYQNPNTDASSFISNYAQECSHQDGRVELIVHL